MSGNFRGVCPILKLGDKECQHSQCIRNRAESWLFLSVNSLQGFSVAFWYTVLSSEILTQCKISAFIYPERCDTHGAGERLDS
ncbi:MAG: hypothetical protein V3G42_04945 [Oscillospiraceae bacterium]